MRINPLITLLIMVFWANHAMGAPPVLRGVVFQSDEGEGPLAGIVLETEEGTRVTTNEDGGFAIPFRYSPLKLWLTLPDGTRIQTESIAPSTVGESELLINLQLSPPTITKLRLETLSTEATEAETVSEKAEGPEGTLEGTVRSGTGPVRNAKVFVRGQEVEAQTDRKGQFSLRLPEGTHFITILAAGYGTETLEAPPVVGDESVSMDVRLETAAVKLAAIRVYAPYVAGSSATLLRERQESAAVAEVLGAEQISKSGDSDAASALKRVTGVSIVGGKYVYVRGLGERYSSTMFNGLGLPSPEPDRRVVPLDLFSTHMLDSIVIQKTYSPDMPGEFSGGVVQLRSRKSPKEWMASIEASIGHKSGTTGISGLHGPTGPTDWLGYDGGFRSMPDLLLESSAQMPIAQGDDYVEGFSKEELTAIGQSLPNHWGVTRQPVDPNMGAGAVMGGSMDLLGGRGGFLLSLDYGNDWQQKVEKVRYYTVGAEGALEQTNAYDLEELTREITLSAFGTMGLEWDHHWITFNSMLARISDHKARVYEGYNRDLAGDLRIRRTTWVERMLTTQQLLGHHEFELPTDLLLDLDWGYALSNATRIEPGRRETRVDYEDNQDGWFISNRPEGNQILYGDLNDISHDAKFDGTLTLEQWSGEEAKIKVGSAFYRKEREVDVRRFKYRHKGPLSFDTEVIYKDPEDIFVPEYINSDGFQLIEVTLNTDSYRATHDILGGYLMGELPLGAGWDMMAGSRIEKSNQALSTFQPFSSGDEEKAELETSDWMPATSLNYRGFENMNIRAGYSRTVSRPNFRELSPAVTIGLTGGRLRFGNPNLRRATIDNFDLRWEWFFDTLDSMAVSAFYKSFTDPIETVVIPSAQLSVSYDNALGANNYGFEFEFRKGFGFIHSSLEYLFVAGNATYIQSKVRLCPPEQDGVDPSARCADSPTSTNTNQNRPLEGQSPYVINAQGGLDHDDWGTSIIMLYNVFGKRIIEVGALGSPDSYEEPFHQLDLVAKQKLGAGFKLGLSAKNLMNPTARETQGDLPRSSWKKGRSYSAKLSYSF